MSIDQHDRVRGILLGLAAGDRNGGPIRMALCLAQSLAERKQFGREDVWKRYMKWWQEGGFDTGPVAAQVFELVAAGIPHREVVRRVHSAFGGRTAGCNPAHRSAPLAMASFLPDEHLPDLAREEALLTHEDPLAGDVAAAVVILCRALVRGTAWETALHQAASGRQDPTRDALGDTQTRNHLHSGGYAPEVLRAACFFVSTHADFQPALQAAIAFAGPENYCPVLVGSARMRCNFLLLLS